MSEKVKYTIKKPTEHALQLVAEDIAKRRNGRSVEIYGPNINEGVMSITARMYNGDSINESKEQRKIGTVEPEYLRDNVKEFSNGDKIAFVYGAIKKYGRDEAFDDDLVRYIKDIVNESIVRHVLKEKLLEVF